MLEVDKKTFEPEVLQAEGYVLVDFFGDGCVPCQVFNATHYTLMQRNMVTN